MTIELQGGSSRSERSELTRRRTGLRGWTKTEQSEGGEKAKKKSKQYQGEEKS